MLATIRHPAANPPSAPPLVIAHGLYGSARNWNAIARRLSDRREVIAVDMRNHGESPWSPDHSYPAMAADLAEVISRLGQPADLLGHSMGGKAAMMLALTGSSPLRRLVVADIAPIAYDHDPGIHARAMRALPLDGLTSRAEADRRLSATLPDPALRAFFLQSLDLRAEGGPRWRLNLPVLEAEMAKITGWPDPPGRFDGPALFVTGALSSYVRPSDHPAILARFPQARFVTLEGAGHWLHADRPREFEATLRAFLDT